MTTWTPATAEIEEWFRIRFLKNFLFQIRVRKKRRILLESTPTLQIRRHFCFLLKISPRCNCRNWKLTSDPGPVFHQFLTPDPVPNEKRRILPESTPAKIIWIFLALLAHDPWIGGCFAIVLMMLSAESTCRHCISKSCWIHDSNTSL